jgi:DNA-binding IclR family transcriptional regulator
VLKTIGKAGLILDLFTDERPRWSFSEIYSELGEPRSTTHTLLASLVHTGLVRTSRRGMYEIGWRSLEFGWLARDIETRVALATPVLSMLSEEVQESVHLASLDRWKVRCVGQVTRKGTVVVSGPAVGDSIPACRSAVGKALIAFRNSSQIRRFGAEIRSGPVSSALSVRDRDLSGELARVRATGAAFDEEKVATGVCCVAAPVHSKSYCAVAAIGISAPFERYAARRELLTNAVREASRQLETCLDSRQL